MPPCAFRLSTKSSIPFLEEIPNVAVVPVSEPNSPTLISGSRLAQLVRTKVAASRMRTGKKTLGIRIMGEPPCRKCFRSKEFLETRSPATLAQAGTSFKCGVLAGETDVALGRFAEPRVHGFGDGALHPRGDAGEKGAGRNARSFQHHASRRDQRFLSDHTAVQE